MKIFARAAALIALAFTAAAPTLAQSSDIARGGLIPPFEVFTAIRSMGLDPAGSPRLRGSVYIVRAFDDGDIPVRVTVDARSGRVLTVTELIPGEDYSAPARVGSYPMPPGRVPSVPGYRPPPGYGVPAAAAPGVDAPQTKRVAVSPRTPTPRVRPAEAASGDGSMPAETTGSIPETKPGTGKSIPAPVARTARAAAPSSSNGAATDATAAKPEEQAAAETKSKEQEAAGAKPENPMVPVAPLE